MNILISEDPNEIEREIAFRRYAATSGQVLCTGTHNDPDQPCLFCRAVV